MRDNKEKLKNVKITGKLIPEIKTKIAQAKKISNVCPISGCIINNKTSR